MGWLSRSHGTQRMIETSDAMVRGDEVEQGGMRGLFTAIASGIALLFSAFSVYETSLRSPELHMFVPPIIRYSSPYQNSNFEVFAIPVSLSNLGARAGTVVDMSLDVTNMRSKESKRFYAADIGIWTMDAARASAFQPFAPITLAGKASSSQSILFYPRTEEKVLQITDQAGGNFRFKLTVRTAWPEKLGLIDALWSRQPPPLEFEMVMGEMDARVFNTTTQPLNTKDWQAVGTRTP